MTSWLDAACAWIPSWIDHQVRRHRQPGCALAIVADGRVVLEHAAGKANLDTGRALTPHHVQRIASQSNAYTAAAAMKLRELGRLNLDTPVGNHVGGLHREVARLTLSQLLSHGSGLVRDGGDSGQWDDRRPFPDRETLLADLRKAPAITPSTRFKYSNHGFGLAGLVIEAVTGEPFNDWVAREIVAPSGLNNTWPDAVAVPARRARAQGHSQELPLGRRVVIPGENATGAVAAATGFVSTAADTARFFASLDPAAPVSVLSPASRREMVRILWSDHHEGQDLRYGLGLMSGRIGAWDWFGHGGAFQSCFSNTLVFPGRGIAVTVLSNAMDGMAKAWSEGIATILQRHESGGPPSARTRDWTGRWWGLWGTVDLVPMKDRVLVAASDATDPLAGAPEILVTGKDRGRFETASGLESVGEPAALIRDGQGRVKEVRLAGATALPERRFAAELRRRYTKRA
jgi:CubicO group peptidase (beta-lactamase class C family)